MQTHPYDANEAINVALSLLRNSDPTQALQVMSSLANGGHAPQEATVRDFHHVRAVCLSKLSRFEEAAQALNMELQSFPDNAAARDLLDFLYRESLLPRSSIAPAATFTPPTAPSQTSSDGDVLMAELQRSAAQAAALLERDEGAAALGIADQMVQRAPKCPGVNYLRVICLNRVGRHEEALAAAEQELLINPTHQGARAEYEHLSVALKRKVIPQLNPEQRSYHSTLDAQTLKSVQVATHNYTYRGVSMIKNPFDHAIYPMLLWDYKPKTIIEIGSKNGGSALWFGDLVTNFGLDTKIYSLDIVKVTDVSHPRVTFMQADGRKLEQTLSAEWIASLPRPLLVIEDADHSYETSIAVLRFFHPHLRGDEMIVIEDGIISDLDNDPEARSGPHRALKEFFATYPAAYDIDAKYADFFGYNYTWCTNGFLRKKAHAPNAGIEKSLVSQFLTDDPVPYGIESQMSANERFQLYMAIRTLLPKSERTLRFIEIGSHAGASLKLAHIAAGRDGRPLHPIAVEPDGLPSFYEVVQTIGASHVKSFSHPAVPAVKQLLSDSVRPEFIIVDGDHSYEGVRQDILDYYEFLAPGGVMIFHDYLPPVNDTNREAIFFHHGGKEPGIRQACHEVMEQLYKATPVELPLLYPTDPTQTQPHLPVIPGVFSTLKVYRKPR